MITSMFVIDWRFYLIYFSFLIRSRVMPISQQDKIMFFNTYLGYSFNFIVVYLYHVMGGIPPPSGGIVGKNRSTRRKTTVRIVWICYTTYLYCLYRQNNGNSKSVFCGTNCTCLGIWKHVKMQKKLQKLIF